MTPRRHHDAILVGLDHDAEAKPISDEIFIQPWRQGESRQRTLPVDSFSPDLWGFIRCMAMSMSGWKTATANDDQNSRIDSNRDSDS